MHRVLSFFLAAVGLLGLPARADGWFEFPSGKQSKLDHLIPLSPTSDYDKRIEEALFLTSGKLARFVSLPSFSPESCVSVQPFGLSDTSSEYTITLTRPETSLWEAMPEDGKPAKKVSIARMDRKISEPLAMAIQRVWAKMLIQTRYPEGSHGGVDGITYQFSTRLDGVGTLRGKAWSPRDTLPAELAALGRDLAALTADKEVKEEPLIEKLKAFEAKIPKSK